MKLNHALKHFLPEKPKGAHYLSFNCRIRGPLFVKPENCSYDNGECNGSAQLQFSRLLLIRGLSNGQNGLLSSLGASKGHSRQESKETVLAAGDSGLMSNPQVQSSGPWTQISRHTLAERPGEGKWVTMHGECVWRREWDQKSQELKNWRFGASI